MELLRITATNIQWGSLALVCTGVWLMLCAPCYGASAQTPAKSDVAPHFDILEYQVEGNSVLPITAIEVALTPFLGERRQMSDVESARDALEKAYQQAGYLTVFVDVPEQRVDDGVVQLRVTEGRVERLKVTGSRYFSQGFIRDRVPELAEGRVPNFNQVQSELASVNRIEDRRVQPVLRPGQTPGTVQAELKVSDQLPLSGNVELNNRHASQTEPLRLSASLRYDNLFQRDHSLAVTMITAPQSPKQSKVLSGTYTVPLQDNAALVGYAIWSDSTVEPLGATTVRGKGITAGLRYVLPFGDAQDATHSVSIGLDYKDLQQRVQSTGDALSTPLRYLPLQAAYNGAWQGDAAQTQFSTNWVFGLSRLLDRKVVCPGNIGPVDQFACSRQGADGGFSTWRFDLRHTRAAWRGSEVALHLSGQLATQPLVSSEQFSVGGADSVRGYLEAEASGDHGILGSAEWRSTDWAHGLAAGEKDKYWLNELTGYAFVDAAQIRIMQPAAEQRARVNISATGVGMRVRAAKKLTTELDLGWPHRPTSATPDGKPRLHARLSLQF